MSPRGSTEERASLLAADDGRRRHLSHQRSFGAAPRVVVAACVGLVCTAALFATEVGADVKSFLRLHVFRPKPVRFIHVPKTGGDTFRFTAANMGVPVFGQERCYVYMHEEGAVNAVLFRDPRAHVMSQFAHCFQNPYAIEALRPAWGFPRGGSEGTVWQRWHRGFDTWLEHFSSWRKGVNGAFNCFNPINMQSRYLTCGKRVRQDREVDTGAERMGTPEKPGKAFYFQSAHFIGVEDMPEPDLTQLKSRLDSMEMVGVTELMKESLCLLQYKSRGAVSRACECGTKVDLPWQNEGHGVTHPGLETLKIETMNHLYNITRVDRLLYRMAAQRFQVDVKAAEKKMGKKFMCGDSAALLQEIIGDVETEHELVGALQLDWSTWQTEEGKLGLESIKSLGLTVADVVTAVDVNGEPLMENTTEKTASTVEADKVMASSDIVEAAEVAVVTKDQDDLEAARGEEEISSFAPTLEAAIQEEEAEEREEDTNSTVQTVKRSIIKAAVTAEANSYKYPPMEESFPLEVYPHAVIVDDGATVASPPPLVPEELREEVDSTMDAIGLAGDDNEIAKEESESGSEGDPLAEERR